MEYVIIFLICCTAVGFAVIKTVRFFFPKKKESNPYIAYQKLKINNDRHYDEYLKWLPKQDNVWPVDKVIAKEDIEQNRDLNNLLNQ